MSLRIDCCCNLYTGLLSCNEIAGDELTDGFHMEAHGYLDREEVNARLIAFARKLEQVLDKWETHAALLA